MSSDKGLLATDSVLLATSIATFSVSNLVLEMQGKTMIV